MKRFVLYFVLFLNLNLYADPKVHKVCKLYTEGGYKSYEFLAIGNKISDDIDYNLKVFPYGISQNTLSTLKRYKNEKYVFYLLSKTKKINSKTYNSLFEYLGYTKSVKILERIAFEEETSFFKGIVYRLTGKFGALSYRDGLIKMLNSFGSNEKTWKGFQKVLNKKSTRTQIDNTLKLLLAINTELNSRYASFNVLNKLFDRIQDNSMSASLFEEVLNDELKGMMYVRYYARSRWQNLSSGVKQFYSLYSYRISSSLTSVLPNSKVHKKQFEKYQTLKNSIEGKKRVNTLPQLSTEALINLASIPDKSFFEVVNYIKDLKSTYNTSFLNMIFSMATEKQAGNIYRQLKSVSRKTEVANIINQVNWNKAGVHQLFKLREDFQGDGLIVPVRIVENLLNYTKKDDKQILAEFRKILKFAGKYSDSLGVSQLLGEVGAKSDKTPTKFVGALFTYLYASESVAKGQKLIGFEVPLYILSKGDEKVALGIVSQKEGSFTLRVFDSSGERSVYDFDDHYNPGSTVRIDDENYKVLLKRKADYVYETKGTIYINELKNYENFNDVIQNNQGEYVFDLLVDSMLNSLGKKIEMKWVLNQKSYNENAWGNNQRNLLIFLSRQANYRSFQKKLELFGGISNEDINDAIKQLTELGNGLEFFDPSIKVDF